ncbi:hypothetical protein HNR23_003119 [Nocardiopsis mwathae]|uniref:Uncharacterized protein n=1 Tax=Nocardiopsis mwathae TaxID=1472723 RepID=A0A7X0D7I8_9ACTN|nr:hypothetical protein [Nocardiopsis mwathae]
MTAALALGASGCAIDLSGLRPGGDEEPSPSPTPVDAKPVLDAAVKALGEMPAVAVQGQVAPSGEDQGAVNEVALTVTGSGAVSGTVQENENEAQVMEADDKLFINAPAEYWLDQDVANPDSDKYAGSWVRVSGGQLGMDPSEVLAPGKLAGILGGLAPAEDTATLENLDGTSAYRVDLDGGEKNRVWISEEEPYRLLRMEIEELNPEDGDGGPRTRLNFAEPESADVDKVYDDLIAAAEDDLTGSRDARVPVAWESQLKLDCATGGKCTVSGTVKDDSSGGDEAEGTVLVRLDATLENDELGEKKCDDTASLKAGSTAKVSCSVDYALGASSTPKSYEVTGQGLLSTRGLSGKQKDELVTSLKEQKKTAQEGGGEQSDDSEDAADD